MDEPGIAITYRLANGKRICIEVSIPVKELLEQSDRQIRSQRRQDRRYLVSAYSIAGFDDETIVVPQEDIADLIIRMDSYRQLYVAVDKLSGKQKRRLHLRFSQTQTYRQIADADGVSHKAVEDTISRSFKKLKEILQSVG